MVLRRPSKLSLASLQGSRRGAASTSGRGAKASKRAVTMPWALTTKVHSSGVEAPFFEDGGFDGFFAEADLLGVLVEVDVDVVGWRRRRWLGVRRGPSAWGPAEGVGAEAGGGEDDDERLAGLDRVGHGDQVEGRDRASRRWRDRRWLATSVRVRLAEAGAVSPTEGAAVSSGISSAMPMSVKPSSEGIVQDQVPAVRRW